MDTYMEMTVWGEPELIDGAEALIRSLEAEVSVTQPTSAVSRLNSGGRAELSDDAAYLLGSALDICAETGGALDVTLYPAVRAWGFTTQEYRVPEAEELDALLRFVDYRAVNLEGNTVTIPEGAELDLGSVAKGYAGDRVCEMLRENGVESAMLNLGGNVQCLGTKPDGSKWRIAVKSPEGSGYLGVAEIENAAVITSGGYERYFERDGEVYWHVMDPKTGAPARSGIISATVIGPVGLRCDALSTALFVMGADRAADFWREKGDFEAILLTADGKLIYTEGLEGIFTPSEEYRDCEVIRRG